MKKNKSLRNFLFYRKERTMNIPPAGEVENLARQSPKGRWGELEKEVDPISSGPSGLSPGDTRSMLSP